MKADELLSPASYEVYREAGIIRNEAQVDRVTIDPSWPAEGEFWLGWTQILRIAECARERYWESVRPANGFPGIDITVKTLNADFRRPLLAGRTYDIGWAVSNQDARGLDLEVRLTDAGDFAAAVVVRMRLRFVNRHTGTIKDL